MPQYKTVGGYPNLDPHYISPEEEEQIAALPKGLPIAWHEGYAAWVEDTDEPLSKRCHYAIGSKEYDLFFDGAEAAEAMNRE